MLTQPRALALAFAAVTVVTGCSAGAPEAEPTHESAAAVTSGLTYYGGPVLQNVKVFAVWWGAVAYESELPAFYAAATNSTYMDWLAEYGGPTGHPIGRGTFIGSASAPPTTLTTIDDSVIQTTLESMIAHGQLPKPDANTLYMNHFAPGVTVTVAGVTSCQQFCSYNGTFISASTTLPVVYGVVPDMGGACAAGCGAATTLETTTAVASSAMLDAITDPDVALDPSALAAPLGWYDPGGGQIADLCSQQRATIAGGWLVSTGWSNFFGACLAQDPPPSCVVEASCSSKVAVTCQAYPQPLTILRTDPNGTTTTIDTLPPSGGTYTDTAPAATEVYQVCGGTTCTAPMTVTVDQLRCRIPPPCTTRCM